MNSAYDLKESSELMERLIGLTRSGKIEWQKEKLLVKELGPATTRFLTSLDGDSEAMVWSTATSVGFRVFERFNESTGPFTTVGMRDLVSISIDREDGPSRGEVYVNLMALLELARRSSDKVEPKIDRVKQYLDKLAV